MVTLQEGFEPPTVRLEGGCSIQLSYWNKILNMFHYRKSPVACQTFFQGKQREKRHPRQWLSSWVFRYYLILRMRYASKYSGRRLLLAKA